MPPPLDALALIAQLPDSALSGSVDLGDGRKAQIQWAMYDILRHEQAQSTGALPGSRPEIARILDLAQMEYGDLVALLSGRADDLLETLRDGDWSLRDLLRHAIAVELRYAAQVEYAASRRDDEPLAIPDERLPCDRLSPPEPQYANSRDGGLKRVLELLSDARATTSRRLAALPDAVLSRPAVWGKLELNVRMRSHQIAAHLTEVIVQSEKMLGADAVGSEAQRILRRCCAIRGAHELWSDAAVRGELDSRYRHVARV